MQLVFIFDTYFKKLRLSTSIFELTILVNTLIFIRRCNFTIPEVTGNERTFWPFEVEISMYFASHYLKTYFLKNTSRTVQLQLDIRPKLVSSNLGVDVIIFFKYESK